MVGELCVSDFVDALASAWGFVCWSLLHDTVYRVRAIGDYRRSNISIEEEIAEVGFLLIRFAKACFAS